MNRANEMKSVQTFARDPSDGLTRAIPLPRSFARTMNQFQNVDLQIAICVIALPPVGRSNREIYTSRIHIFRTASTTLAFMLLKVCFV